MGRGKRHLVQYSAEQNAKNSKGGCSIVPNAPSCMRRGKVPEYEYNDLMAAKGGRGQGRCRYPFEKTKNKWKANEIQHSKDRDVQSSPEERRSLGEEHESVFGLL